MYYFIPINNSYKFIDNDTIELYSGVNIEKYDDYLLVRILGLNVTESGDIEKSDILNSIKIPYSKIDSPHSKRDSNMNIYVNIVTKNVENS